MSLTKGNLCFGEGNGNPLQYSCLENSMDGGTWQAAVHGVAQSWTQLKQLSSSCNVCLFIFSQTLSIDMCSELKPLTKYKHSQQMHLCLYSFVTLKIFYIFLAALGLCCYVWAFSSCREQGLLSGYSVWASHCGGFSFLRITSCRPLAQQLWHMGLVAPWHVGSSRTRD